MSNLNRNVVFDVRRGWKDAGAIEENLIPADDALLREGEIVVRDSDNHVDHPDSVGVEAAAGGDPDKFLMVIQGNDQWDAQFVGKVTCLRGLFTVRTEKFVAPSSDPAVPAYTPGTLLTVSTDTGTEGWLTSARTAAAGGETVVGEVIEYSDEGGETNAEGDEQGVILVAMNLR